MRLINKKELEFAINCLTKIKQNIEEKIENDELEFISEQVDLYKSVLIVLEELNEIKLS